MNTPTCTIEIVNKTEYWLVQPIWNGVDRPAAGGYSTGKNYKLAQRLAAFMRSGKAWISSPEVLIDIHGKSYINANLRISTRYLNAELKRFGF